MKAKVYTRGGDGGETSLIGGTRVSKGHERLEVYGTLDELNSVLGVISSRVAQFEDGGFSDMVSLRLKRIQNNLFNLGSHAACEDGSILAKLPALNKALPSEMEQDMDQWESELPELKNFILPGGTELSAFAHLARTVCRRSEREWVRHDLFHDPEAVIFLNRLSDWLFLLARKFNALAGESDQVWEKI